MQVRINDTLHQMEDMVHGFDFRKVILAYLDSHHKGDDERKEAALRWLRGEFTAKSRRGRHWAPCHHRWQRLVQYVRLLAGFVRQIGYRGLILFIRRDRPPLQDSEQAGP